MTLYMIGLGLTDDKDISVRGLETVKNCDFVYLESYTSVLNCAKGDLFLINTLFQINPIKNI